MTTTTPPPEVRAPERTDDTAPPSRRARRRTAMRTGRPAAVRNSAVRDDVAVKTGRGSPVQDDPAKKGAAKDRAPATTGRPVRAPAPRKAPERRAAAPPRAPFVLLVVGLLGGALVSLLLLNTVLAQDAFTLSELQRGNQQLSERREALQEDIARESSPEVLHQNALRLGMKDPQRPAFIDAPTGRTTESGARPPGVPDEAMAATAAAGVAGAPGALVPPAPGTAARGDNGKGGGTR
jgi:hypothetical protein